MVWEAGHEHETLYRSSHALSLFLSFALFVFPFASFLGAFASPGSPAVSHSALLSPPSAGTQSSRCSCASQSSFGSSGAEQEQQEQEQCETPRLTSPGNQQNIRFQ
eukprot:1502922-Rhodomonas_salina.1